jgi:hypothetical protein
MPQHIPVVVTVGGEFGGLATERALKRENGRHATFRAAGPSLCGQSQSCTDTDAVWDRTPRASTHVLSAALWPITRVGCGAQLTATPITRAVDDPRAGLWNRHRYGAAGCRDGFHARRTQPCPRTAQVAHLANRRPHSDGASSTQVRCRRAARYLSSAHGRFRRDARVHRRGGS